MNQHETIVVEIHRVIESFDGADTITALSVATAVQGAYAAEPLDPYIAYASLEHFKQMARQVLASKFDVTAAKLGVTGETAELFSEHLQERYPVPVKGAEERSYKRLELLTEIEIEWNATRLERAGRTLLAHARALRSYRQDRAAA